jgi:hypothetical protein
MATWRVSGVTIRTSRRRAVGPVPGQLLDGVRNEQEARVGVRTEHDVRGVLHQEPVALLRRPQLALQPLALADVPGDAADRDQPAVLHLAHDADLERHPVAVLVADQEAVRERPARVGGDLGDALARRERGHVDELRDGG